MCVTTLGPGGDRLENSIIHAWHKAGGYPPMMGFGCVNQVANTAMIVLSLYYPTNDNSRKTCVQRTFHDGLPLTVTIGFVIESPERDWFPRPGWNLSKSPLQQPSLFACPFDSYREISLRQRSCSKKGRDSYFPKDLLLSKVSVLTRDVKPFAFTRVVEG